MGGLPLNIDWSIDETWLHKTNPSFKLLCMLGLFAGILFIHNINILVIFTVGVLLFYFTSTGHPFERLFWISLPFALIFVSTSSSMILFGTGKTIWWEWGLIAISEESFFRGIHIGFRALSFAALGLLFTLTTRPVHLFYSLMQQLKVSPKYAYSFMAGMRLIPIMLEEFQTVQNAMKVRGVREEKGFKALFLKIKAISIPLLSQSIRRAHRIAVAMEAKGFSKAGKRTFYYKIGFSVFDLYFFAAFTLLICLAIFLGTNFPVFPVTDVRG